MRPAACFSRRVAFGGTPRRFWGRIGGYPAHVRHAPHGLLPTVPVTAKVVPATHKLSLHVAVVVVLLLWRYIVKYYIIIIIIIPHIASATARDWATAGRLRDRRIGLPRGL